MKAEYVYVASSWSNELHSAVVQVIRGAGIGAYDFKNDEGAQFHWSEVGGTDPCTVEEFLRFREHHRALEGFGSDYDAMCRADHFVVVLPCGASANLELGWAVGQSIPTAILLESGAPCRPELMYHLCDLVTDSILDILDWLGVKD